MTANGASRRLMIIGLDGATLDLIRPWAEAGFLPNFRKLMQEGTWGPLRSTMPPLTPVAWSTFMTGMNPGKHGVFDFTPRKDDSYESSLVKSSTRQAPSFWQLASRTGKQVIVYNVPVTYPPERVNGLMVSGLMTPPGATDASYPPELQKELEETVPGSTNGKVPGYMQGREAEYVEALLNIHSKNMAAARYLMHRQPWDLFVTEFQHTDTIGHSMWKDMDEKGASAPTAVREIVANAIRKCYQDIDSKLGELIKEAGENTYVFVMSDHGHGRLEQRFDVNTWLLQKGYIQFKRDPWTRLKYLFYRLGFYPRHTGAILKRLGIERKALQSGDELVTTTRQLLKHVYLSFQDIDWSRTRAYSVGYCGPIYVNLKGREPHGIVEPGQEYDAVLDQLAADLATLKEPGKDTPLFPEVHIGREAYWGPFADRGPDLLYFPENWSYVSTGVTSFPDTNIFAPSGAKTGTHRPDGILFLSGPGIKKGHEISGATLMDIAPTALALLGVPVPEQMDGHVLEAAMAPDLFQTLNVAYNDSGEGMPELVPVAEMSEEDEAILVSRLRDLGYIA